MATHHTRDLLGDDVPDDLADDLADDLTQQVAWDGTSRHQATTLIASSAASAAARTSDSEPVRYTRPVAPTMR